MPQRDRRYSHGKLISWLQRRCERCQRFLSRKERKFCSDCRYDALKDQVKENYHKSHPRKPYSMNKRAIYMRGYRYKKV